MSPKQSPEVKAARQQLIEGLNEDLSREYQAIIAYVVYSQVMKGAQYMSIAAELEKHAHEELDLLRCLRRLLLRPLLTRRIPSLGI